MTADAQTSAERMQIMEFYQLISSLYAVKDILLTKLNLSNDKERQKQ